MGERGKEAYSAGGLKKLLIIYGHFPPSNLAGVHRPRLFAQHLPVFGWEPTVLTVHEDHYFERLDHNLIKLLPGKLRIIKTSASKKVGPIGDIGLRGFFPLYKKALELLRSEQFDFVLIPVPSFYAALLGPKLFKKTGVPYGIDYIDPWVHTFPGSQRVFSKAWFSTKLARFLERRAVKYASLITGVAEGYYNAVLKRNPHLKTQALAGAMPYGGEKLDHSAAAALKTPPCLFKYKASKFQLVYAGAMLPKAYEPLEKIFIAMRDKPKVFANIEFHFIGTGSSPNDEKGFNIKGLAEKYGLWQTIIFEYPARIAYLDVLIQLVEADAVFVLGSTEPHYTPSKLYQAVLSERPVLAVLHEESTAAPILENTYAGIALSFNEITVNSITENFPTVFERFRVFAKNFDPARTDKNAFAEYSAERVTEKLATLIDNAIASNRSL